MMLRHVHFAIPADTTFANVSPVQQYPRQSSSGRRELRAMERPEGGDRPHTAASNSSRSRSKGRLSSVDNVRILSDDNAAVAHDQQQVSHSAQNANRYSVHRHGYTQSESQIGVAESLRAPPGTANGNGPEFSDMDDAANGEPGLAIDGTQGTLPIPNRNRYAICIVTLFTETRSLHSLHNITLSPFFLPSVI